MSPNRHAGEYATPDNIAEKAAEWLTRIYSCNYKRTSLILDKSKCALIVIDMLNYFADPSGRSFLFATEAIVPGIVELIEHWRQSNGTVVFTRHCHTGIDDLGMLGKFFSDYIHCDKPESMIITELAPLEQEAVFRKTTYDGFHDTGLEEHLINTGCEQVLITGVLTQLCCETTARSAFVRGFEVYMPVDGMASSTEDLHIGSLFGLASGFASISDVNSIIENTDDD